MTDLPYQFIAERVAHGGYTDDQIVKTLLARATRQQLQAMAAEWIRETIRAERRTIARRIEVEELERLSTRVDPVPTKKWSDEKRADVKRAKEAAKAAGFRTVAEHRAHQRKETSERNRRTIKQWIRTVDAALDFTEAFLNSSFALGDGRRVTWGEATVEDHETRIAMMQAKIAGCEADVERHRNILNILNEVGATCLNDLRTAA